MLTTDQFDVLDRDLDVFQTTLLEASAGTGKTFSIENLVVRLLAEEREERPLITIDQVLLVTFTRAATRELRQRVRSAIEGAVDFLRSPTEDGKDYLIAILEEGKLAADHAIRRLEEGLFRFDEATIATIHGFCAQAVREHAMDGELSLDAVGMDEPIAVSDRMRVIKDFFRTELDSDLCSPSQLALILKEYKGDVEKLSGALLRFLEGNPRIDYAASFSELLAQFQEAFKLFCEANPHICESAEQSLIDAAPSYKKICNRAGEVQPEIAEHIHFFCELLRSQSVTEDDFDRILEENLLVCTLFSDENQKKRVSNEAPHWIRSAQKLLLPIVTAARHPGKVLNCLGAHCLSLMRSAMAAEEKVGPDDLLELMHLAVQKDSFANALRKRFKVVVVDEFQDTDLMQWGIFQTLFLRSKEWPGIICLVGDPKQAIYAFRRADIYTYLDAANDLKGKRRAHLTTNYRSQPELVQSLNYIFTRNRTYPLFPLPSSNSSLDYHAVNAPEGADAKFFKDDRRSIHCFIAEGEQGRHTRWPTQDIERLQLLPFIAQEIQLLNRDSGIAYRENAILVRDRYQAEQTAGYLKQWGIPSLMRRTRCLTNSPAYSALKELLHAILNPRSLSAVKCALAGPILGWNYSEIQGLQTPLEWEPIIARFHAWYNSLEKQGFARSWEEVLASDLRDKGAVVEHLTGRQDMFHQELQQLVERVTEYQSRTHPAPDELLEHLVSLDSPDAGDNPLLQLRQDPQADAVQILTLHTSKGLEFGVVYALGLANRAVRKPTVYQSRTTLGTEWRAVEEGDEGYQKFQQEEDAEKMRLLYVAMTRAKWRLYLPVVHQLDQVEAKSDGESSPMELLIDSHTGPVDFIKECNAAGAVSWERLVESAPMPFKRLERDERVISEPEAIKILSPVRYVESFTSLSSPKSHVRSVNMQPPRDYNNSDQNPFTIPAGPETGTLLHKIFETIPLHQPEEAASLSERLLKGSSLDNWHSTVSAMVMKTLRAPLGGPVQGALCEVAPDKVLKELEFLHPSHNKNYLKGFVDLIFEWEGKTYILDWKSNWLGPSSEFYQQSQLHESMVSHDYLLQGKLYAQALQRYWEGIRKEPFDEAFGGVFYLFLRGIDATGAGVYYFRPEITQ